MELSPVRRLGTRESLRARLRLPVLIRTVLGTAVVLGAKATHFPGSDVVAAVVVGATFSWSAVAAGRRLDQASHAAERLHRRAPRQADVRTAPRPSPESLEQQRRRHRRWIVITGVFIALCTGGTVWGVTLPDVALYARALVGFCGGTLAIVAVGDIVWSYRWLARAPRLVTDLPAGPVTVLGFTGPSGIQMVVAPGVIASGHPLLRLAAGETPTPVPAGLLFAFETLDFAEAIPGDVLICHGTIAAQGVVALADDEVVAWVKRVRSLTVADLMNTLDIGVAQPWGTPPPPPRMIQPMRRETPPALQSAGPDH